MIGRRAVLSGLAVLGLAGGLPLWPAGAEPLPGDHATLAERARALAARPHRPTAMPLHPPFAGLDYDSHRGIRPRPGGAGDLRLGPGFRADLVPPGFLLDDRVAVTLVQDGLARQADFAADLFSFDPRYFGHDAARMPADAEADMGFAGLRLRHPLNRADHWDELAVFQGASYFRALGRGNVYGLSARGLAIGTGGPRAEEFPVFTHLRAEALDAATARVAALMESPSATGAFSFLIRPGAPTVMEVEASLFPRIEIAEAGIAPLTSMYYFGPMRRALADDFRPAVHDSDTLVVLNGAGERLWRPLANPAGVQTSAFLDDGPRGFGLVQSLGDFGDFLDAEAAYHQRPSAWVEPLGDWGPGAVMLVEIPTGDEFSDNIVAFWQPRAPLRAGTRHDFRYRLYWGAAPAPVAPMPVLRSLSGRTVLDPEALTHVVDFDGQDDRAWPELSVQGAETYGLAHYALPDGAATRVSFQLVPGGSDMAELRLVLRGEDGAALSDTWLYRWTRGRDGGL
jgi:periplasmic glucans biosynthesis protein